MFNNENPHMHINPYGSVSNPMEYYTSAQQRNYNFQPINQDTYSFQPVVHNEYPTDLVTNVAITHFQKTIYTPREFFGTPRSRFAR